jgi:stage II sporulation protein D
MKNVLKLAFILAAVMIMLPLLLLVLNFQQTEDKPGDFSDPRNYPGVMADNLPGGTTDNLPDGTADNLPGGKSDTSPGIMAEAAFYAPDVLRIKDEGSGEIVTVPMRDYVIGAVMAEVPATFPPEALKAQAAAIASFALRQAVKGEGEAYDVSNAVGEYIAYFNQTQGRAFYADGFDAAYKTITAAVDEVMGYAVVYDSEPIIAAYCSCSPGTTESAANVWGTDVPYLVPVDSAFDKDAPVFNDEKTFTALEIKARLETETGVTLTGDPLVWFKILDISPSGTILNMTVGGEPLTGRQFREALNLKSAAFSILYENETFTIHTSGYGHGVGMSQYGAKALAEKGYDWQAIIKHYYKGVEIVRVTPIV